MRILATFSVMLGLVLSTFAEPARANEAAAVGKKIDAFKLTDFRGKEHALGDFADSKLVVVAFLGTECPLAKLYVPRLVELSNNYASKGVTFVAIDSNRQDSITELAGFAQRNEVSFPLLKDPDNRIADTFGAQRTPEVFVLDQNRTIRYRGRIDDQYGQHLAENNKRISYQLDEPRRRDLAAAIDELLEGKEVSVPTTEAAGCLIGRVSKVEPNGAVTYSKQISRILQNRCVECHRDGEVAPFALTTYDEVVGWSEMIREVVQEERMPPWFANPEFGKFKNDCRLPEEERQLIYAWVDNGSPQGDPAELPEPRQFVDGWQIQKPDQVVYMEEAYEVPAEGTVEYQYFTVDPGWTEGKWIKAAECRPGNRAVVHHIIGFIRPGGPDREERARRRAERKQGGGGERREGNRDRGDGSDSGGFGYAPGMPPRVMEDGSAVYAPPGSKIVFQMHYTPNGTAQKDRSYIGFVFADPSEVKYRAGGAAAMTQRFAIPPGDANHKVESEFKFEKDMLLTEMQPHMHLRGKSFQFIANYPDGKTETLLDVPRYDFNWQLRYALVEPKLMPAGTTMKCIAHFDNSEENLANPDPTKTVTWGDQTWEEMMIGWFMTRSVDPIDATEK